MRLCAGRANCRGMGDSEPDEDEADDALDLTAHLDGVETGAGCTEIWERLSERRRDEK